MDGSQPKLLAPEENFRIPCCPAAFLDLAEVGSLCFAQKCLPCSFPACRLSSDFLLLELESLTKHISALLRLVMVVATKTPTSKYNFVAEHLERPHKRRLKDLGLGAAVL